MVFDLLQRLPPGALDGYQVVITECRVGIGFPAQQRVRIDSGAMGPVAELDTTEITLGPFRAGLWSAKILTTAFRRWRWVLLSVDPPQRGMEPIPAAGLNPSWTPCNSCPQPCGSGCSC